MQSYQSVPLEGNPTQSEVWALTQSALKMRDAVLSEDLEQMKSAVRLNWRLWTIFQADLLSEECQMPVEIRQNVLTLAHFIDKHSVDFFGEPDPNNIDVLININREIAGGLSDGVRNSLSSNESVDSNASESVDSNASENTPDVGKINLSDFEA